MWNPLKVFQKKSSQNNSSLSKDGQKSKNPTENMGMVQRLAMKQLERMSPQQRQKLMQKVLTPENINKNREQILATMRQMKASGQITEEQIQAAKKQFGI